MATLLKLKDYSVSIPERRLFKPINFELQSDQIVSIKGPSGSGKSTLLKSLVQLNTGDIIIDGHCYYLDKEVNQYPPVQLRQSISYVSQNPQLFGESVYDNLAFPFRIRQKKFDVEKASQFLIQLGLTKDQLHAEIHDLSGGERQRVGLIRHLFFPPQILLLDEVTAALDEENRGKLWQLLMNFKNQTQCSMLIVSHSNEDHQYSDHTVTLEAFDN